MSLAFLAPLVGGVLNKITTDDANAANYRQSKEFAQNRLQWLAKDAEKAGYSKLAALGNNPFVPSPSFSPADFSSMGQDLSRAIMAQGSHDDRLYELQIQGASLDNEMKKAQLLSFLGRTNSAQLGPSVEWYQPQPQKTVHTEKGSEPGPVADFGLVQTPTGYAIRKSKDMQEATEDDFIQQTMWAIRNNVMPNLNPAKFMTALPPAPKGKFWDWDTMHQEFQLKTIGPWTNMRGVPGGPDNPY